MQPDFEYKGADAQTSLDFIHRRAGEAEVYFVCNRNGHREQVDTVFRVSGKQPELWDAVTGEMRPAGAFSQEAGRTIVPLEFAAYGSCFVVFQRAIATNAAGQEARNYPTWSDPRDLGGGWEVAFDPKWGGPEAVPFDRLVSWPTRAEAGIKYYSGKATYRKTFDVPEDLRKGRRLRLNLGVVKNVAEVRLNGRNLGVVWTEPFSVDITGAVKPTGNKLEIDVINLWPNRMIGDAALPAEKRLTRTNVSMDPKAPLVESGLLGPVTLQTATLGVVDTGGKAIPTSVIEQPPAAQPVPAKIEIADGLFKPTWESLKQYKCPDWFRDAKLGIWAHWGPQAVPMHGDWYARAMYEQGQSHYEYHVANYGHPSVFGYKDLVQLWKAEKWDPDRLVGLYQKAGARYFVAMANHHDNWDNWNSKYHRWNAVNVGPKKDIVGLWANAARKHGLRFGVTEHVARSYSWFNTNKGSDKEGPLAGVPYDGNDPKFQDLYFPPHDDTTYTYPENPPEWWPRQWFWRIRDLIDTYQPDLLYTDGAVPYGEVGRSVFAHYYNANMAWHGGKLEAVYNLKDMAPRTDHGEYVDGIGVQDVERGTLRGIKDEPWQTDTCIGNWFYKTGLPYKSASQVICMLCDIVSKNGNLLLSIPLKPDGTLDAAEEKVLAAMGAWMDVNGEAIYGTRPWKVFGEGRSQDGGEDGRHYSDRDIRFTTKGDTLYALVLGWPDGPKTLVRSLASGAGTITEVSLLGYSGELKWKQTTVGLEVVLPANRPSEHAFALKISGGQLQPMPISSAQARYDAQGRIMLEARDAKIHGDTPRYELDGAKDQIGFWSNPKDYVSWTFEVLRPGSYDVAVTYSCATGSEGDEFVIESGDQKLTGKSVATGSWFTYVTKDLGQLKFEKAGSFTLAVKPKTQPTWKTIGLQSVVLTPQADLQR